MKYYVHVDEAVRMDTLYLVEADPADEARAKVLDGVYEAILEEDVIELIYQDQVTNVEQV